MEKLLTPAELAQLLGVAVQTIYNRLHEGRPLPPCVRIGRLPRFTDVEAWLAALPMQNQPASPTKRRPGRPTKAEQIARRNANLYA